MKHYIELGIDHILDLNGLDHFYFIISFCIVYTIKDLRKILGLITAFTVGHSITLALSLFNLVSIDPNLIEWLIPLTILISCLINYWTLLNKNNYQLPKGYLIYFIILTFGLIHGLGFSNFLSTMLFKDESILIPLLGFNIGIEIAQLIIVFVVLLILSFNNKQKKIKRNIRLIVNTIISLLVLHMIFQ